MTDSMRRWFCDWPHCLRMAREGKTAVEIAAALNRTVDQVQWKCRMEGVQLAQSPQRKFKRAIPADYFTGKAPEDRIADRDARYEASQRRTPTQTFFGDPPPGYSALDKKYQAEAQRP